MMIEHALKYRRMGLSIIPVSGKIPLIKWREFQERLPNEEEIKEWWTKWPEADIGMVTGPITQRLVLDIDGPEGINSVSGYTIPLTQSVRTKRGFQYHFKYPEGMEKSTVAGIRTGVDARGLGGYVKLPPSATSDGGHYAWLNRRSIDEAKLADAPQWLIDDLTKPAVPLKPEQYGKSQVDQFIEGVADGGRYQAFTVMAGFYFGSMRPDMAERHLKEWNQKNRPPWDEKEINDHIQRFKAKIKSGELTGYKQEESREQMIQAVEQNVAPFSVDITKYLDELSKRGKYNKPEFPTGFSVIDGATRGFPRSNIYVIGAPTGGGKTQFVLAAIHALIREGKKVLYFSTEMPQEEIRDRFNAIGADIPLDELRTGRLTEDSRLKLVRYLQTANHANFVISKEDTPSLPVIRAAVESVNPDVLIIDHIHHIKMKTDNRRIEVDDFIIGFKKLILERNIPGIVTAQLHRKQADVKGNVEYTEHDFKESGGIENEAGVCLLLCPPDEWTTERFQNTTFSIRKNRHGRKYQKFSVRFDTVTASFKEGI